MFRATFLSIVATVVLLGGIAPTLSQTAPEASPTVTVPPSHLYNILISNFSTPPRVTVSLDLPDTWKETIGNDGAPQFAVPGISGLSLGVTALLTGQSDAAANVEKAIELQYGKDTFTREDLADGRVWATSDNGRTTHLRMFVPMDGGVVMGLGFVNTLTEAQRAEVKAVFETLRVVTP